MVESTESNGNPAKQPLRGSTTFIVVYGLCLLILFGAPFLASPTTDFTGHVLRQFTVAGVITKPENGKPYRVLTLEQARSPDSDLSGITFLLPKPSIVINVGNIHRAEVLEDEGSSQLIAFHYSNSRTSTSIYRAFDRSVEPVSYKVTSDVGQGFSAVLLFIPALILSAIVTSAYNWFARRRT